MNKILVEDNKFKSLMVGLTYILPLDKEEVSKNALVALVLEQGCDKYRSEKEIKTKLASLYNSEINVNIDKLGNNYTITFSLDLLNKKYIKKDVLIEALEILKNIIYIPYLENGLFCEAYIEREKEALISRINEVKNNKKRYALNRLEEEMFSGEVYGVNKLGKIEDIEKLTNKDIYKQYLKIINEGNINVIVSGNTDGYENIIDLVIKTLEIDLNKKNTNRNIKYKQNIVSKIKNIEEYEDLSQSVLCMGLKFKDVSNEDVYKMTIYNAILGETPASKLFQNVREKESLAYFAKAEYIRFKGAIYIYTGINISNLDKAKKVINAQIEDIKNGVISNEEFEAAKKHSISKLKLITDSKEANAMYSLENSVFFEGAKVSIKDIIEKLENISKNQIIEIAKKIEIDTIYLLGGNKEDA